MTNKELDKWIAENVMGWRNSKQGFYWIFPGGGQKCIFNPTESISDAFQVVEKMFELRGYLSSVSKQGINNYFCEFFENGGVGAWEVQAKTAPIAICLTAKKAIEAAK